MTGSRAFSEQLQETLPIKSGPREVGPSTFISEMRGRHNSSPMRCWAGVGGWISSCFCCCFNFRRHFSTGWGRLWSAGTQCTQEPVRLWLDGMGPAAAAANPDYWLEDLGESASLPAQLSLAAALCLLLQPNPLQDWAVRAPAEAPGGRHLSSRPRSLCSPKQPSLPQKQNFTVF